MPVQISRVVLVAAAMALLGMALGAAPKPKPAAGEKPREFKVFNNMAYAGQPDLSKEGLIHSAIIYEGAIWKDRKAGHMPEEQAYKDVVTKKNVAAGGVIVLDIEDSKNYKNFVTLVKWTHEACPGSIVGFYAHGTESKELAKAVDAFFPEAYTFSDNRAGWKGTLEKAIKQAHAMAPGKPVYPYMWPQYHHGAPKSWQFVSGDYWKFQLDTARQCGANGVVLWGASELKGTKQPGWKENAPWWQATLKFMAELKQ